MLSRVQRCGFGLAVTDRNVGNIRFVIRCQVARLEEDSVESISLSRG